MEEDGKRPQEKQTQGRLMTARKDAQRSKEGGGAYVKKSPITEDTE